MTDDALVKLIASDPDRGIKKLIEKHGGLVNAVISGRLRSSGFTAQDAEDCAAETFFEFWRGFEKSPCAGSELRARLCVIAKRNAIDRLRRQYREPDSISADSGEAGALHSGYSLEGDLESREQRRELINAVKALGRPDSEIIIRKFYLGQSSKEIASFMKMSVSNVDTRTHRAIEKLRKELGGNQNE